MSVPEQTTTVRECPFPDCDWEYRTLLDEEHVDDLAADHEAELHYEREHAGRVRVQVTLEFEQLLCGRTPEDVREMFFEQFEDKPYDVAYVRSEVLEEPDDHSVLGEQEVGP